MSSRFRPRAAHSLTVVAGRHRRDWRSSAPRLRHSRIADPVLIANPHAAGFGVWGYSASASHDTPITPTPASSFRRIVRSLMFHSHLFFGATAAAQLRIGLQTSTWALPRRAKFCSCTVNVGLRVSPYNPRDATTNRSLSSDEPVKLLLERPQTTTSFHPKPPSHP